MKEKYFENNEIIKLIRIFLIIVGVFVCFYCLAVVITNQKQKIEITNKIPDTIQYDEILFGNLLNRPESSYYVLATFKDDQFVANYNSYVSSYLEKDGSLKFYYVDMNNQINSNYVSKEEQFETNIGNIKINKSTLFKVDNGIISSYYSGNESILSYLKELNK